MGRAPGTRGDSGASPHFRGSRGYTCEGPAERGRCQEPFQALGLDGLGLNHNVPTSWLHILEPAGDLNLALLSLPAKWEQSEQTLHWAVGGPEWMSTEC